MVKKKVSSDKVINEKGKTLRELAEEKVLVKNGNLKDLDSEKVMQIMQELQTHQIELEMQNEELKQSQLDLEESRNKYSDLYNFAPVGYITLNEKGIITMSNITSNQLLGIEKSKLINTPFTNYIFRDDQDRFYLNRKCLLETKEQQQFELRIVKSEKSFFWAHVDSVLSEKNEGDVLITITDISKIKKDEEALRDRENRYKTLFETIVEGILIANLNNHKFIYSNPAMSRMFGYSEEEFRKMSLNDLHPKEKLEHVYSEFEAQAKGEKALACEIPCIKKDGSILYADINSSKTIIDGIECNVGFFTDITERRQAEEKLKNILALSEANIVSINNGILAVENNGDVIKTNREFAKMWNVPENILVSKEHNVLLDYVLEQLKGPVEFKERITKLYTNPEEESFDFIYFKDGRIFERISKPMHIDGRAVGRVWSFFDITERIQREKEIKNKNEELIELNAEKDKFFSIIAHDLRSPFTVFLGFTEMLKEDIHGLSLKELQTIANSMNRSANNLFELLTNLLDWSMIQRNDYAFHPVKLSLNKIINESTNLFAEAAEKKEIKMETYIADDVFITGDESMLKTILRNLISNALKFTNKGGQVSIIANISDNIISISVKDTGIGMPEDLINDLYKIDVRVSRKGTDNEPSTGLGLLLCKEFIEKHNGKMWLVSEEGKGSEFTVSLPLIQ